MVEYRIVAPPMKMASQDISDQLKNLTLEDVVLLSTELGRGAYGKVFTVKYLGLPCAAKKIHALLLDDVSPKDKKAIKDGFIRECYHSSLIRHPNIVQFMGVYYEKRADLGSDCLPIMVMELMDTSLRQFIEKNQSKIALDTKVSILHDVSLGLTYLHGRRPAVIHRDLSSNNVLLSGRGNLIAKISDLGTAKMIRADSKQTKSRLTTVPGTVHFMPPEALEEDPVYSTPVDVFSFAGLALHLFSEEWPTPANQVKKDPKTKKLVALTEAERRHQYLDKMRGEAGALREMVERCLDNDPDDRPLIKEVVGIIESFKETPPLAEALKSGHYHIKWTSCSNLPTPLYGASVSVSGNNVYAIGEGPVEDSNHQVFCYDILNDQWNKLPPTEHFHGILCIVDQKLNIFGGKDPVTREYHNKVSTYDKNTNSWCKCYPNMLRNRHRPGVITYNDHVIVMGGNFDATLRPDTIHDSIEVMNCYQLQWKEVSAKLPVPMWAIQSTISGDDIIIVGHGTATGHRNKECYQIGIQELMLSLDQPFSTGAVTTQWKELSPAPHYSTTTVPYTNPSVTIGGYSFSDQIGIAISDVSLYDPSINSWVKVDVLTSARDCVGVGLLNSNTIIVIGGTTHGNSIEAATVSSLTIVEIGNVVLNY